MTAGGPSTNALCWSNRITITLKSVKASVLCADETRIVWRAVSALALSNCIFTHDMRINRSWVTMRVVAMRHDTCKCSNKVKVKNKKRPCCSRVGMRRSATGFSQRMASDWSWRIQNDISVRREIRGNRRSNGEIRRDRKFVDTKMIRWEDTPSVQIPRKLTKEN